MKKLLLFFVALVSADTVVASAAVRRVTGLVKPSAVAQVARGQAKRFATEPSKEDIAKSLRNLEIQMELLRTKSAETNTAFIELQKMNLELKSLHEKTSKIRWVEIGISAFVGVLFGDVIMTEARQYASRDVIVKKQEEHQKLMAVLELVAGEIGSLKKAQQEQEIQAKKAELKKELTHVEQLLADIKAGKK